jgi:hypothetical protein
MRVVEAMAGMSAVAPGELRREEVAALPDGREEE